MKNVILVGGDLLAHSRVRGATGSWESESHAVVSRVRSLSDLAAAMDDADVVVIDLARCKDNPTLPLESVLAQVQSCPSRGKRPFVLAFGPHVDAGLLRSAREGGCTLVVPNSMLEETLARIPTLARKAKDSAVQDGILQGSGTKNDALQDGASALTLLVFGAIIGVILYAAYSIVPFYYYYYELQNHFEQIIPIAGTETDMEIRRRLLYHIRRYELPVEEEQLNIVRSGNIMSISLKYTEVFLIEWKGKELFRWDFPFHAHAEGEY